MITWRYHILTLAAIFLALSLGVLIGIALTDSGTIDTSQAGLVSGIQHDLNDLRDQNDTISRDNAINLRFQEDTFPYIVGTRLQGKRIAVIAAGIAGDDIQRKLTSAIRGAGGQVVSTTVLNSRFDQPALIDKVKNDMKSDPAFATVDESSLLNLTARELAREVGKAGGVRMLTSLQGILVDSTNGKYDTPVDAVVVIARADDEQTPSYSELEKQLVLGLKEVGIPSVGCEPSDAPRSEIPVFQSADISTVDNLDSHIGQVSVVYSLAGERGGFGTRPTADMLIPILRNPKPQPAP